MRALVATQAGLTIIFASFAPFTLLWYAPSSNYRAAILFNGAMFAAASWAHNGCCDVSIGRLSSAMPATV